MTGIAGDTTWVLLLRGINVNSTTRVSMGALRELLTALGYADVQTLLQSGNVLLTSPTRPGVGAIEKLIAERTGVRSQVVVLSLAEFAALASANPLLDDGAGEPRDDLSKLVITFLGADITPDAIARPSEAELAPELLVITPRAIYQWLPDGVLGSKLTASWWRQLAPLTTARNVRTVNRILAAATTRA